MNPADYQYRYGQPPPPEQFMEIELIISMIERLGLPAVIIAAAFWFIRYQSELGKKEREEMWQKDSNNDERLMHLVESTTKVMEEMKSALQTNTDTMRELLTEFRISKR